MYNGKLSFSKNFIDIHNSHTLYHYNFSLILINNKKMRKKIEKRSDCSHSLQTIQLKVNTRKLELELKK